MSPKNVAKRERAEEERSQQDSTEAERYLLQIEAFIQDVRNSAICGIGNQSPIPAPASLHLRQRE
jgi:hypothetical protein